MARPFFLTRYCISILIQSHGFEIESPDGSWRRDAGRQFDVPLNFSEAAAGNGNSAGSGAGASAEAPGDKRKVNGQRDGRQRQRRADDDRLRLARRRGNRGDVRVLSRFAALSRPLRDAWTRLLARRGHGQEFSGRFGRARLRLEPAPLLRLRSAGTALRAWSSRSTV